MLICIGAKVATQHPSSTVTLVWGGSRTRVVNTRLHRRRELWDGFLTQPTGQPSIADTSIFADKRVLITGASGFIGAGLAQALSSTDLDQLLLLDIVGSSLLEQEKFITGSVCDELFIDAIFDQHSPQIIFHAAALKHVPMMENEPFAAAKTNVLGTQIVASAAARFGAEQFILVSTDKAVDPVSIMGATKRIAELITFSKAGSTQMKALRLCNVLGSSGSVAPLFAQQIADGLPLTITDFASTRYFISLEQTVEHLLAAASPTIGSSLLIPAVGKPYRIEDLAKFMLAAAQPSSSAIVEIGLRIGDKLHEQMTSSRESILGAIKNTDLLQINSPVIEKEVLDASLEEISQSLDELNLSGLLAAIGELVPEYTASELLRQCSTSTKPEHA